MSDDIELPVVVDGDEHARTFVFAHGAGAGKDHEFMQDVAKGLSDNGIRVVRFDFPYMAKRAIDGKRRPPDRAPKLLEAYAKVITEQQGKVVIGGKSMGGRMASLSFEHDQVLGAACLGFPFHPPKKLDKFKGDHLADIFKPTLILQGERDTFGSREEVSEYSLSNKVSVEWINDGDHSFVPRKRSGFTYEQNIAFAVERLTVFINQCFDNQEKG